MSRATYWLAAGLMLATTASFADQWDKKTILKVGETIQVPGAVLEPGTYVLKLLSSESNRHIVQITNEREDKVITTILAIPNYRLTPQGNTVFGWWETPIGNPRALRAWFYPGDSFGQEFAYPKGMSAKIAETAHVPVPSVTAETPAELKTAPVVAVQPSGEEKQLPKETYQPTPVETQPEPAVPTPAAAPVTAEPARPEPQAPPAPQTPPMPKTGSPYEFYLGAGILALTAGLSLRAFVRRI
jgi:hypothetical protein